MPSNSEADFWPNVEVTGFCWNWTRPLDRDGYGKFRWEGVYTRAHRVAYRILVGEIPQGLTIDHLCRNKRCVNPDHLEPVTSAENLRRRHAVFNLNRSKTACAKGHPFDKANTHVRKSGKRECRRCDRESHQRRYRPEKIQALKG